MEEYEEKLLDAIEKDVRSNADLVEKVVNDETDALRNDQIGFFKEGLEKETTAYLESELKDLRLYAATKSSKDKLEMKKQLLELRAGMVNELFKEVNQKLKEFTSSDKYNTYLEENLANVAVTSDGYFEVREADRQRFAKILKDKGFNNEIRSAYFEIGGFRYIDEVNRIEFNCCLVDRQKEQFEWFRNNSGFKVAESEADK